MLRQSDFLQGFFCPGPAFLGGYAGNRKREFDVGEDGLMGYQMVTLKNETDCMIPVGIPVAVAVFPGRYAVYQKVAAVVAVEASDYIKKSRFPGAGRTEHSDELAVSQVEGYVVQSFLNEVARAVFLGNVPDFKHIILPIP